MKKIITIAAREYRAMVGTKAFAISIAVMPLLMFGGIAGMEFLKNMGEVNDQRIVVVDSTGQLFPVLELAAQTHNKMFEQLEETAQTSPTDTQQADKEPGDRKSRRDELSFSKGARYYLEKWEGEEFTDQDRLELSARVRKHELYAFLEIPAEIMHATLPTKVEDIASLPRVRFYSEDSSFSEAKTWLREVINEFVKAKRLEQSGIDPILVAQASVPIRIQGLGLAQRSSAGEIQAGKEKDEMSAIFLPLGVLMLMFMVIFMASQPMLESVLEEKANRIAEVLLGSANPFQLMSGKLLGTVGGSLTIFGIYLCGGYAVTVYKGWGDQVPFDLIPWFVVYQICGVLFFASIFMAVGASVTQLKEAQTMLLPVWMLLMSPMFVWIFAVREPNGPLAKYFSLFPPATPTMMMLRMSTGATIPIWQPVLGLLLLLVSTMVCVYIASRIFRVGLLWQGKTPKLGELFKWALRG